MMTHRTAASIASLLITACVALPTQAAEIISPYIGTPAPSTVRTDSFAQAGWGFWAAADGTTIVDQLGFWAASSAGDPDSALAVPHTVQLLAYQGATYLQVASATIPAGSTPDADGYAWASINPIILGNLAQSADFYIVTATVGIDTWGPFTGNANVSVVDTTYGGRTGNGWFSSTAAPGDGNSILGTSLLLASGNGGYVGPNVGRSITVIDGVTVSDFSSELGGFNRLASETVDGSGLNGGLHNNDASLMWLTGGTTTGDITFDLGENDDVKAIRVWNYNEATAGLFTRGANEVEIFISPTDNPGDFVKLLSGDVNDNFFFDIAAGSATYLGFLLDLSGVSNPGLLDDVRLVQFNILSNHGDGQYVGLAEVQFLTSIPAPAALPAGLAMLGLAAARRRR